jgi:hypothetical protein
MKNAKITLIILFFIVSNYTVFTQEVKNEKCACCSEAHQAFDFWVGDWTVYNTDGKIVGTNSIQKEYDNCVLKEQWKSSGLTRGTSYNYYNTSNNTWNQVWVDNTGFSLELKGMYTDGKMILISDLLKGEKGSYYHRITWLKNDDDTVTQIWDLLSEKREKTREMFKGLYKKKVN